jgi:hypothetical protein
MSPLNPKKGYKYQAQKGGKISTAPYLAPLPFPAEKTRDYIYSFELTHSFPNVRSFIFKKPLSRSMSDTFMELVGGGKKRQMG